ncbi:MAG: hypothetical protein PSY14_01905 [bacterium]|nr:hypothetical protein [bacterium]
MSSPEKTAPKKYATTLRNGKPFIEYTPEYKAHRRHKTRWPDRIVSGLVGLAGAAVIGTIAVAASYVLPLVPVAAHASMAALSAIASGTGAVAAAGVAALGGVALLAVVGVAGLLAAAAAFRLYDEYKIAMENDFRPVSALSAGGVTLAMALGMAVTVAPEPQQAAVSKIASASTAFDTANRAKVNTPSPAVQSGQAAKNSAPALAA